MKIKLNKIWFYAIQAFFTALTFSSANRLITLDEVKTITDSTSSIIIDLVKLQLNYSNGYGVHMTIVFLLLLFFFYHVNKDKKTPDKRLFVLSTLFGLLFATFMMIGNRFMYEINFFISIIQTFITLINFIGYFFLFKNVFIYLVTVLKKEREFHETKTN